MKQYKKLDSYIISNRPESKGNLIYLGSSIKFKTQKDYKDWLLSQTNYLHLELKIMKSE